MFVDLETAVTILQNSGVVAFPTETVYGLGAIATDTVAIKKVYKAKNRPSDNPLICHFTSLYEVKKYTQNNPKYIDILIESFSPGPVSFLLSIPDDSPLLPSTCGLSSVACRIPNHPIALELIQKVGLPIAGPSANISTRVSGTTAQMVQADLGDKIDGILDGGVSNIGLESTILDCREEDKILILRPGFIGAAEIRQVLDQNGFDYVQVLEKVKINQTTPGNKYAHYSPKTPVFKTSLNNLLQKNYQHLDHSMAILAVKERLNDLQKQSLWENIENYTQFQSGIESKKIHLIDLGSLTDLEKLASKLYYNLYTVDSLLVEKAYLIGENWENSSLGKAIANRLSKVGKVDIFSS